MTDDFVAPEVVQERMPGWSRSSSATRCASTRRASGRTEELLVEGPSKKDPTVWSGRTRQNKLVHFVPGEATRPGELVDVRITSAAPHFLRGELVARVKAAPRRRVRIPVAVV